MTDTVASVVARTGAYAAEQSVAGVETFARTGAWVVMEGAQVCLPFQRVPRNAIEGGALSYEHTRRGEEERGQDINEGRGVEVVQPGRRLTDEVDSDRDMLLTALETAEAKGHMIVAKTLRVRLGLPPVGGSNRKNSAPREDTPEEEEDKEIWESVADLA